MAVVRLLKSWATPPASRPMASIFCAWLSCASRSFRSVRSRTFMTIVSFPSASRRLLATASMLRNEPSRWPAQVSALRPHLVIGVELARLLEVAGPLRLLGGHRRSRPVRHAHDDAVEADAVDLPGPVSGQPLDPGAHVVVDHVGKAQAVDDVAGVLDDEPETLLGFAQRVLGLPAAAAARGLAQLPADRHDEAREVLLLDVIVGPRPHRIHQ